MSECSNRIFRLNSHIGRCRRCSAGVLPEDGVIMCHQVRSVAYKGKSGRGEPAEWVTIEPPLVLSMCWNACHSGRHEVTSTMGHYESRLRPRLFKLLQCR